jgi:integrase
LLTVRKSLNKTKDGYVLKDQKTAAGRRTVALPPFAIEALAARRAGAEAHGLLAAPVFCTKTGGYLDKKNVLRAFRALVEAANRCPSTGDNPEYRTIPVNLRFHDLRHTVASLLLSSGQSLRAVSQRLGHAKPTMTLAVYVHCMPTDDNRLADGLHAMLGRPA